MYNLCRYGRLKNLFSCFKNKPKPNINKKLSLITKKKVIQKSIINKKWNTFFIYIFEEKSRKDSISIYEYIIKLVKIPNYAKKITSIGLKEFKKNAKKNLNEALLIDNNILITFLFIKSNLSIFFEEKNLNNILKNKEFFLVHKLVLNEGLTHLNDFMEKFFKIKKISENKKFLNSQLKFLQTILNKSFEFYLRMVIKIDFLPKNCINLFLKFSNSLVNFFIKIKNYFDKESLNKKINFIEVLKSDLQNLGEENIPKITIYKKIEKKIENYTPKNFSYLTKEEIRSFFLRIENLKLKSLTKGIFFSTDKSSSSTYEFEFEGNEKNETMSAEGKSHFLKNTNYEKNFLKLSNFFSYKKKIEKKFYSNKKKHNRSFSLLDSTLDQHSNTFSKTFNSLLKHKN